ncbi:MAG: hypothetical protein ACI31M_01005 [Bacilli bacterium]
MSSQKSNWSRGVGLLIDEQVNDSNFNRLFNLFSTLALNRFTWNNLPKGLESRHIENALFRFGQAGFVDDKDLGLICLPASPRGLNVYGDPTEILLTGNGYSKEYKVKDVVRIMNNDLCYPTIVHINYYADKISRCDKAIDMNVRHQKTPYILKTTKQNELSMKNLINKIERDDYTIFIDEKMTNGGDTGLIVDQTLVPFVADKLQEHKNNLVCELLTILGLNNNDSNNMKKERLIVDEVNANNQEIEMYLDTDFKNRKKACEEINAKFGLNITVDKVKYDWAKEIEAIIPNNTFDKGLKD